MAGVEVCAVEKPPGRKYIQLALVVSRPKGTAPSSSKHRSIKTEKLVDTIR